MPSYYSYSYFPRCISSWQTKTTLEGHLLTCISINAVRCPYIRPAWWPAGPLDHSGTAAALAPVLILETSAHYCVRNSLLIYGTQPQLLKSYGGFENSLESWAATFAKALKAKKEIEVIAAHGTPSVSSSLPSWHSNGFTFISLNGFRSDRFLAGSKRGHKTQEGRRTEGLGDRPKLQ